MSKNYTTKSLIFILMMAFSSVSWGQTLVHYWNFNDNTSVGAITTPTFTLGGAVLNAIPGGISTIDFAGGTGQNFSVLNLNARNGDVSGTHLRFNDPIGGALEFALPTTGYENIIVKFATRRSGSGAGTQSWFYTLDGTNYVAFTTVIPNNGDPALATLDFSGVSGANNNPSFKLRVEFAQGSGGTVGNNRFDNFTLEGTTFGGADTIAPVATFVPVNAATNVVTTINPTISFNENIRLIDNSTIDNTNVDGVVELRLNDASGALVAFDATISGSVITVVPNALLANSQLYYLALLPNTIEDESDNAIATTPSVTFTTGNPSVALASNFITVNEAAGTLSFNITLTSPATSSVDLVVKGTPFSTADDSDFTLASQTLNFTGSSALTQTITIPIIDDLSEEQQAEYFVLSLENAVGLTITGNSFATVYIVDNDRLAPVPSNQIELNYIGSFDPSGANTSTCEIVVHDPASQRLFTTSAVAGFLDIIDFSDPTAPTVVSSIDMNSYGGVTSVAVKNGVVAVASPNADETLEGSVVFFDTNGTFLKQVTVGALPDMITFSPDGTKVMTANEGQPNANYSIDPEGSVSVIDISGGIPALTQANVSTLLFTAFNAQEASLIASGVRKLKMSSTMSQDFEPEYITISADSQKAWVTLQENNAVAEINLATTSITDIWALGTKDVSLPGNGFDISDNNGQVLIANWPINAFYIPDAIANYTIGANTFLVTANEGDEKEYTGFNERTTVGAAGYVLDATVFPNASVLKQSYNMGRYRVTNLNGNADADGDFETINAVGTRSFSIFNATTQQLVYDSGDDFEMYTSANFPTIFNADHEDNTPKGRSRAKGPEAEGVTVAQIGTETFAFISLERVGGVMVYNVTDPNNPTFVAYKNSRSTSAYAGDHGPEGITYIAPENSPTGLPYVLVANEISGTITIFEIDSNGLSTNDFEDNVPTFAVFPNPSVDNGLVYFNRTADIKVYDLSGKLILAQNEAQTLDTKHFTSGVYLIKTGEGIVKRLIIK
ncbi:choice-of-anchor I family protein [Flavobacterium sp. J49]|uniref:choice-of-anchor I family protein n=1 Tax=Flavobacterium sp. J49 TaxID=2718534 RepID=UPI001593D3FF|nr:choice-of-anchor I family protein [Flavobacterium sp. J49]MBF6642186.1 choice-of-anchor I family protein [Flavobacterium sp. J49]NIC03433.1 T9SS type A sorting domain-containing protein [Flavobacterium sp. J49]